MFFNFEFVLQTMFNYKPNIAEQMYLYSRTLIKIQYIQILK